MTINNLYKAFHSIKEVRLIGKEVVYEGKIYEIMGFYRIGRKLMLAILEYDEVRSEYDNEEEEAFCEHRDFITNRDKEYRNHREHLEYLSATVYEMSVDEKCYKVVEGQSSVCHQTETTLMLAQFFESGWKPQSIGKLNLENVVLSTLVIEGKFNKIPQWRENPKITLKQHERYEKLFVEMPIRLEVDKIYPEKIYFKVPATNEQHWVMINGVSVVDMFTETMKQLDDPRLKEQVSESELKALKLQTEQMLLETCPKGSGFFSVEYESDENMQLVFYSQKYLESEPTRSHSATMFMVRSDKKTGKLGQKLQVCLLNEPVDLGSKAVETEIFLLYKEVKNEAICFI